MARIAAILLLLVAVSGCGLISQQPILTTPEVPPEDVAAAAMAVVEKAMSEPMAVEGDTVTLSQVVAFLFAYGLQVCPSDWDRWDWTPAPPGSMPVAYYVVRAQWAVAAGDLPFARLLVADRASGPYMMKVRAYDQGQRFGPWSLLGYSDNGNGSNTLPGVGAD